MWVIYEAETGNEIDRVPDYMSALDIQMEFNRNNPNYYHAEKRWEE